jgi:hypothetical protein
MDLYESHKDWAEKVPPAVRKDRDPFRPHPGLVVVVTVLAALAVVVLIGSVFLMTGVLVQR